MTFQTYFAVYGDPVPKGRPRFTRQGRTYTPKRTHDYETEVAMMAKAAMGSQEPLKTPVMACIYITYAVPPSYTKKRREACLNGFERPSRHDIDNVCKAVLDACNGIVYLDDKQVCSLHTTKVFGDTSMVEVYFKEELL